MAKVILQSIGSPVENFLNREQYNENLKAMAKKNKSYTDKRKEIKSGWGEEYIKRLRKKGKLTTWERIDRLKDPGTDVYPIGTFVNYGIKFGEDENQKTSPGQES